ncbi:N-fatty-acyl-amino acid synthase/hydrolase PM20D1-like [Macrosteles quadrilineatus]|uniref:N-fatty-acyl-amino acid synthase/hydrolase PM20D1-like n=1 Tax=Macrosteles quadrilineatus TaxID=74068 RepID=UPI0023E256E4|nr:N-fatty-acyl-amino acid synthase/hydrolase PM20D1-like [Macrosteles quadrilineatus]
MGLGTKRKSPWRHRWCHKLYVTIITVPIAVSICLSVIIVFRSFVAIPDDATPIIQLTGTDQFIDESKILERAERLAGALRIPTVSYEPDVQEKQAILKLHQFIEKSFPLVHSSKFIKKDVVNDYSLLYTIQGSNSRAGLLPYLLASHLDVVPADPKTWEVPPFSGNIINKTYIYGRGAIDDKSGVMGILEALENLLEKGERPVRSFFIAFGHDEEISGRRGAQELAKVLVNRGIQKLDFVLDEGFPLIEYPALTPDRKIAMIGVTEKGSLTLELSVTGSPGHSSLPPSESPIGILASAVAKLEDHQQPIMFGKGPEYATFQYLAPYVPFWYRLLYSNLWLFSWLIAYEMDQSRAMRPFVRTTTAITKFNSGIKDNVIPPLATATVNHRIHPAQTVSQVVQHDREIISDPRVRIRVKVAREAHPVSTFGPSSPQFQLMSFTIKQVFPDAVVVPGVFIANTDTRWYLNFTSSLYRFIPTVITPDDLTRYHGNNERISVRHYHQAVNFYYRVIKNADLLAHQTSPPSTHTSAHLQEL